MSGVVLVLVGGLAAIPELPPPDPPPSLFARIGAQFGFEAAIGPYRPDVDGEFSDQTPYADILGRGTALMPRLRLNCFIPTAGGDIGVGVQAAWFRDSANALTENGSGRSAGETAIRLIPISVVIRWRWPHFDRWLGVPLAVTVSGGANYTLWAISRGDGGRAEEFGESGEGGTLSVQVEGSLGLLLGRFDRRSQRILKKEFGVEDTEIGVSLMYVSPPIGWWDQLHVGGLAWQGFLSVLF